MKRLALIALFIAAVVMLLIQLPSSSQARTIIVPNPTPSPVLSAQ